MYNNREYLYVNLTSTPATTQVFTGKGILHSVILNSSIAGTVKLIDNTTGTTANVGTISAGTLSGSNIAYDVVIANGLRIVTATSPFDITVTYTTG